MEVESPIYVRDNDELMDIVRNFNDTDENNHMDVLNMDFQQGQSVTEIPGIRKLPFMRDDGYQDTFQEAQNRDNRPWNKDYYSDYLKRMRILDEDTNMQFIEVLSGLMDEEPTELYVPQDLDHKARERDEMITRTRLELKRNIVSLEEKEKSYESAKKERDLLEKGAIAIERVVRDEENYILNNQAFFDKTANDSVRYGIIPLIITGYNLSIIIGNKETFIDLKSIDIQQKIFNETTKVEKDTIKLIAAKNGVTIDNYLLKANEMLLLYQYFINKESSVFIKNVIKYNENILGADVQIKGEPGEINWSEIIRSGQEEDILIDLDNVETIYGDNINDIILNSYILKIGKKDQYYDNLSAYLKGNETMKKEILSKFNLFEINLEKLGHLSRLLIKSTDKESILKSYFVWYYFENASLGQLAIDTMYIKSTKTNELYSNIRTEITQQINKLKNRNYTIANDVISRIKNIYNTIPSIKQVVNGPENLGMNNFDDANKELLKSSPIQWITNDIFLSFFKSGRLPDGIIKQSDNEYIPDYINNVFPILMIYPIYVAFVKYSLKKNNIINDLVATNKTIEVMKNQINRIRIEINSRSSGNERPMIYGQTQHFTSLPMNSGIIRLRSFVRSAMERAYRLIQKHCKKLKGLPYSEFQSNDAMKSGLLYDYAYFVSTIISQVKLLYPSQYKSKILTEHVITTDTSAFNALKAYNYRKTRIGYITKYEDDTNEMMVERSLFTLLK